MTAAIEGGEWSAARPGRTLPPGKTRYSFYRRLCGLQGRSGRAENLVPTGIRSRIFQPAVSRYTVCLLYHYIIEKTRTNSMYLCYAGCILLQLRKRVYKLCTWDKLVINACICIGPESNLSMCNLSSYGDKSLLRKVAEGGLKENTCDYPVFQCCHFLLVRLRY